LGEARRVLKETGGENGGVAALKLGIIEL